MRLFDLHSSAAPTNDRIIGLEELGGPGLRAIVTASGGSNVIHVHEGDFTSSVFRLGITWKNGEFMASMVNGRDYQTSPIGQINVELDNLHLGCAHTDDVIGTRRIYNFKHFKRTMTQKELEELTR